MIKDLRVGCAEFSREIHINFEKESDWLRSLAETLLPDDTPGQFHEHC